MAKRICPQGHAITDDKARFCSACGAALTIPPASPSPPAAQPNAAASGSPSWVMLLPLLALLLLCGTPVALVLWASNSSPPDVNDRAAPQVSGTVRLRLDSAPVYIARDESAHRDFMDVVAARDTHGLTEMLASGELFVVADGTLVRILDRGFGIVRVRVLEGTHEGRSGWVIKEAMD